MVRCVALTSSNRQCRGSAVHGSTYCVSHIGPRYFFPNSVFLDLESEYDDAVLSAIDALKMIQTDAQARDIVNSGVLPKLLACLDHTNTEIVERTLWALVNFASMPDPYSSKILIEHNILPILVRNVMTRQSLNAAWCLANIAGTDAVYGRHVCSEFLTYEPLLAVLQNASNSSLLRGTYSFLLENMARAMNDAELELLLKGLGRIPVADLEHDPDVCLNILSILKLVSEKYPYLYEFPTEFLLNAVRVPKKMALVVLGNIMASENKKLIQTYLDADVITILKTLLDEDQHCKEILWMFSNIACEIEGARRMIECTGLLDTIVMRRPASPKDGLWTLTNLAKTTTTEGALAMVSCDILTIFTNSISYSNVLFSTLALQGIVHIMEKVGDRIFAIMPIQVIYLLQGITEDTGVRKLCDKVLNAHNAYRQILICHTVRSAYQVVETYLPTPSVLSVVNNLWARLSKHQRYYAYPEDLTNADKDYLRGIGYHFDTYEHIGLGEVAWARFVEKN